MGVDTVTKKLKVLFFSLLTVACLAGCGSQRQAEADSTQNKTGQSDKLAYFRKAGIPENLTAKLDEQQMDYLSSRLHLNEGPVYGGICQKTVHEGATGYAMCFLKVRNKEVQEIIIETMSNPEDLTAFASESSSTFAWDQNKYVYNGEFRHESGGIQNRKYEIFEEGDHIFQEEESAVKWSGMLNNPDNNLSVTKVYDNAEIHLKPVKTLVYREGENYGAGFSYEYELKDGENMLLKSVVICIMVLIIFIGICWQNLMKPKNYEEEID